MARFGTAIRVRGAISAAVLGLMALAGSGVAEAHPHVWVRVETTVLYQNGTITGFRHKWTFDEFYTAMAVQGLDANNDGVYTREELAELAKVNIDGLKDFAFFTHARLAGQPLALTEPKDYWLDHGRAPKPAGSPKEAPPADGAAQPRAPAPEVKSKGGVLSRLGDTLFGKAKDKDAAAEGDVETLSLIFTLPLQQPVLADAADFTFAVYDASFFIAFDFAGPDAIKFGEGAPANCRAQLEASSDDQRLGDAFAKQLGQAPVAGYSATRPIKIICGPRS